MNLFHISAREVRGLIDGETDPTVLRHLVRLEAAARDGDELERIEAIGDLTDLLVLERGCGW